MRRSAVRNSSDVIDPIHVKTVFNVVPRKDTSVPVSHDLDIDTFIGRCRITVIAPEESADLHIPARCYQLCYAIGRQLNDLSRAEVSLLLISHLGERV